MIGYTVSIEGLVELEMDLNMSKDKTKNILRTAINNTAKKVESQMSQKAGQRYTLKEGRKGYHSINKIDKAKISKLYNSATDFKLFNSVTKKSASKHDKSGNPSDCCISRSFLAFSITLSSQLNASKPKEPIKPSWFPSSFSSSSFMSDP